VVRQAPYSPDMASCDFWLFPHLKGTRFKSLKRHYVTMRRLLGIHTHSHAGCTRPRLSAGGKKSMRVHECPLHLPSKAHLPCFISLRGKNHVGYFLNRGVAPLITNLGSTSRVGIFTPGEIHPGLQKVQNASATS
jgi:hypothetical protein